MSSENRLRKPDLLTVGVIGMHYKEKNQTHFKHNFNYILALALGKENFKTYLQSSLILKNVSFWFQNYFQPPLIWWAPRCIAKMQLH